MNKKQIEDIQDSINMCKMRLKTIQPHLTPEKTALNESFNKLLIEKAILRDRLMQKSPSLFRNLIKRVAPHKKELICDYFK
ncbi:hypothetical protein IJD15_05590 [bacterium]|nr:hypothetical protein [bacterium]